MILSKKYFEISVELIPEDTTHEELSLILLRTPDKKYVFGKKYSMYPTGISRLIGGPTDGSNFESAAQTHLLKQVGLSATRDELVELAEVELDIFEDDPDNVRDHDTNKTYNLNTQIFLYDLGNQPYYARREIDSFAVLDKEGFRVLNNEFQRLSNDQDTRYGFSWLDWGKIFGPLHEAALDAVIELESSERVQSKR